MMLPAIKSTGGIAFLLIVAVVAVGVSNLPSVDGAVREFTLVVHHQDVDATSMSGEVVTRLGTYVNETYPGPTLTVDLGDEVVVKVINEMPVSQATIHFHGQHQVDTYYMDGVPHVTQCAINPLTSFEYRFTAGPAGTFFYHSHMPFQVGDGFFGPFIVNDPENDPYYGMVEEEIVLGFSDWLRYYSDTVYQYVSQFRFDVWPLAHFCSYINGEVGQNYTLVPGGMYRLRIYCSAVEYGYRLFMQGHNMTVIAADGSLVTPTVAEYLDVYSGERYDVLITADQTPGAYLLLANVLSYTGEVQEEKIYASFIYEDATALTASEIETALSEFNATVPKELILDQYTLTAYRDEAGDFYAGYSPVPGPPEVLSDPLFYHTTSYAVLGERQYQFMDSWDFQFNTKPSTPLFQLADDSAIKDVSGSELRSIDVVAYNDANDTHVAEHGPRIQFLEKDQVVDIVFQNAPTEGNVNGFFGAVHPMHIHGHYFWALASGEGEFDPAVAAELANFVDPPSRDNLVVGANTWVYARLQATNAGIWLMHCHSETHAVFGMMTTLVVGTAEERPPIPEDFVRCGPMPAEELTDGEPEPTENEPEEEGASSAFDGRDSLMMILAMVTGLLFGWM